MEIKHLVLIYVFLHQMQVRRLAVFVNRGKQQIILYIRVANATISLGQAHVILNPLPPFFSYSFM